MQEETEVLGENLRGQVWIENQIHIRLWPDWESNPGRIGERHGNNRCANPPATMAYGLKASSCHPLIRLAQGVVDRSGGHNLTAMSMNHCSHI